MPPFVRIVFGLFFLMSSSYCLLAYIPFTYQWVIKCTLVRWLPVFVKLHPLLYWIVLVPACLTLVPDLRRSQTRRLAVGFIVFHTAAGMMLLLHPLLSSLANDDRSFCWSLISLFPLLWIAAIDYAGRFSEREWAPSDDEHLTLSTAVLAAAFLTLLYMVMFLVRFASTGGVRLRSSEFMVASSWSLASHTLLFTLTFVAFSLIRSLASRFARPGRVEFLICNLMIALLLASIVRKMILSALTFNSLWADFFSVAVSFSSVAFISGLGVRLHSTNGEKISAFRLALGPLLLISPGTDSRWSFRLIWIGFIALLAFAIPASIAQRDWDFLIQKLGVIAIWSATFVFFYAMQRRSARRKYSFAGLLLILTVSGGWYAILGWSVPLWPALLGDEQLDVSAALERYAGYDVSFKLARDILRPNLNPFASTTETSIGSPSVSTDQSFYGFLRANTNLLPSVKVNPVDIKLAGDLAPTEGAKPNIFIFVIDSLRQDYISPYNQAVGFTPNIEGFARESLVWRNAFTRYGGTVLAEPSIWTGALQLHKQYIEPFYPMNSLQKLIEAEAYESFITIDPVVRIITNPSAKRIELDRDNLWFEYDFCRTLKELQTKIGERQAPARPMFVYTEPQNVHRVVLQDKGERVPPGEHYPGFYGPYASQVKYMDACFGEFLTFLKSQGLYDDSIIILTSDHGDSLGEEGRWGHSYWLFPEILRVPLIIHLPAKIQQGLTSNSKAVAFTTDITPTLYYLLGHRLIARNPMFGRPLLTSTAPGQTDYLQDSYLVVSSYGPVYGIVSGDARSLFIADAVNQKNYFFNLAADPKGMHNRLTPTIQAENERLIHDLIVSINRFYKVGEYP